jgi:UDP-N-acetylmuramate--alanine ligase
VIYKIGLPLKKTGFQSFSYGVNREDADVKGFDLRYENGKFLMDVQFASNHWEAVELGLPGVHNAENALAVCAMCLKLGLSEIEIRSGLKNFKGVKRRFEYQWKGKDLIYIDDYAHHPTEIEALVSSIRLLYPHKKVTGIFQPHLFSRTQDFLNGFETELAKLDQVILMPIYPAREEPIPGITSDVIVKSIGQNAVLMQAEDVLNWAKKQNEGVVLTIGAGDIDRIVPSLKSIFEENEGK